MTSPAYDLTLYSGVSVEFKFISDGMEPGEDFWLQYFNGSSWTTVATLISGNQFVNNQLYTVTVNLSGTFSSASKFRIMCDASENDDIVYVDAVIIRATTGSSLPENSIEITPLSSPLVFEKGFEVFPNPVSDVFFIRIPEEIKIVEIYNVSGQRTSRLIPSGNSVDVSELTPGLYIVRVETEENVYNTRIIRK